MLDDELWSKLKEIKLQQQIYDKPNLLMIVEAMLQRMPIEFQLTGVEVHDAKAAPDRIEKLPKSHYSNADKGYVQRQI